MKIPCLLIAAANASLTLSVSSEAQTLLDAEKPKAGAPIPDPPPNIVFILADDLSWKEMPHMDRIKTLLQDEGTTFNYAMAPNAVCCPARSSFLTGKYSHNTLIHGNSTPHGGEGRFRELGLDQSTLATWLQSGGYTTALIGKYLNQYPEGVVGPFIPPGWDRWVGSPSHTKYDYELYVQAGRFLISEPHGHSAADFKTSVLTRKALSFLSETRNHPEKPFFLFLTPPAPHGPLCEKEQDPRTENLFTDENVLRGPSHDEDLSDKPLWLRDLVLHLPPPAACPGQYDIDDDFRLRLRFTDGVQDMIQSVIDELVLDGRIENTYVVFMSDNGFQLGEHRIPTNKRQAYEESIRVPLIVRGPNVGRGQYLDHFILDHDLTSTLADIAKVAIPSAQNVDGKSFLSLLAPNTPNDPASLDQWRHSVLIENWPDDRDVWRHPQTFGVRTRDYKYVEYFDEIGPVQNELYDLQGDPYETNNLWVLDLVQAEEIISSLKLREKLVALKNCVGDACREAESANTSTLAPAPAHGALAEPTRGLRIP